MIVSGDLNLRTSDLFDYLPNDDTNFPCLECPRYNIDGTVNNYGRRLINLCIETGVQILNGRNIFTSNTNKYTYTFR